jgi:hypothetical protein
VAPYGLLFEFAGLNAGGAIIRRGFQKILINEGYAAISCVYTKVSEVM